MAHITFSEASGLQDSVFGKSQAPIRRFLEKRAEAFEQTAVYKALFDINPSSSYAEKLTGLTAMGDFQAVGENGAYPVSGMQEGYSKTLEHVTWKNSFSISREIMDDSKLLDLRKRPEAFIAGYHRTRELYGAALLGGALLASSDTIAFGGAKHSLLGADGKRLFATNHPMKVKGANGVNAFSDALSETALVKMEAKMQNTVDDSGNLLNLTPDTIVIPNDYAVKKLLFSILGADKDPSSGSNAFNYLFGRWNVIVWPYLNQFVSGLETVPWMMFDSAYNKQVGTLVWFDRVPLEVRSQIDPNTDANVWRGYARFVAGFNDWRGAYAGGITGGASL
ncbi:MAG: hypothetical protein II727_09395 [Oscillospiraceae bacterium]|nr:hypothetical protein [Oscillospiraceae bacterium]